SASPGASCAALPPSTKHEPVAPSGSASTQSVTSSSASWNERPSSREIVTTASSNVSESGTPPAVVPCRNARTLCSPGAWPSRTYTSPTSTSEKSTTVTSCSSQEASEATAPSSSQ